MTTSYDLASQLLLEQYNEWATTFKPIEQQLLNQISWNNPSVLPAAVSQAATTAQGEAGAAQGIMSRENRSLGIMPTKEQEATSKRVQNLSGALNVAGAENKARSTQRNLDEKILLGVSSGGVGSLLSGSASS